MITVIFGLLIAFGIIQVCFWIRVQQKTQRLNKVEAQSTQTGLVQRVQGQTIIQRYIVNLLQDLHHHLVGRDRSLLVKHAIIILIMQGVGIYLNHEFLHLGLYITQPLIFILSVYVLYLRSKKKMRQDFELSFAEALNVINSSLRAGNTVIQGMGQCGEKMSCLLGEEFQHIAQRLEIGEDTESVLLDSWQRFPYREYYFFITTVVINLKGGGQVREVMSRLSTLISNSRITERKKYAMTSEARMSVKILAVIPMGFMVLMKYQSPASFDILLNHPIGQILFYYAIGSIILGLLIVWMMMSKI